MKIGSERPINHHHWKVTVLYDHEEYEIFLVQEYLPTTKMCLTRSTIISLDFLKKI